MLKFRLLTTFFEDKSSICNDAKFSINVGMLPVILFSDKSNKIKFENNAKNDGIVPTNEFP